MGHHAPQSQLPRKTSLAPRYFMPRCRTICHHGKMQGGWGWGVGGRGCGGVVDVLVFLFSCIQVALSGSPPVGLLAFSSDIPHAHVFLIKHGKLLSWEWVPLGLLETLCSSMISCISWDFRCVFLSNTKFSILVC